MPGNKKNSGNYVSTEKALAAAATLVLLMAGWLFTLVIQGLQHIRDRQENTIERVAKNEAEIKHIISSLERTKTRMDKR